MSKGTQQELLAYDHQCDQKDVRRDLERKSPTRNPISANRLSQKLRERFAPLLPLSQDNRDEIIPTNTHAATLDKQEVSASAKQLHSM